MKKIKKENLYFFWSAAMVLCIALSLIALIFSSCGSRYGNIDGTRAEASGVAFMDEEYLKVDTQTL